MGVGRTFAPEFPGATVIAHSNFDSRGGWRPRYIIVHSTASPGQRTAQEVARYFQRTARKTGTHYVVGEDGAIVQCVREGNSAWGNGKTGKGHKPWYGNPAMGHPLDPNKETISIEHVKTSTDNHEALTPAQAASSARLILYLCLKWGIPMRAADVTGGIDGHASIDPVRRAFCPGAYPWDALYAYLHSHSGGPVSTPAPSTTSLVHRVLDNFESISEFPDTATNHLPHIRVACWVAAAMAVTHALFGTPMTAGELVRLYNDMTAHHDMGAHGTTPDLGESYVRTVMGKQTIYPAAWHWHAGTQMNAIHAALIEQAGINGLVMELGAAHNLPFNEGGVNSHYIGIGGIDSIKGYLVANGDDILALAGHGGHAKTFAARWITWDQIARAVPTALVGIQRPTKPSSQGTGDAHGSPGAQGSQGSTVAIPTGWSDDGLHLLDPDKNVAENGFRALILSFGSAWRADDTLRMKGEVGDPDGSFLATKYHTLEWTPKSGVVVYPATQAARFFIAKADAPVPAPAPPPAPDPEMVHALAVVQQVKTLVASFN